MTKKSQKIWVCKLCKQPIEEVYSEHLGKWLIGCKTKDCPNDMFHTETPKLYDQSLDFNSIWDGEKKKVAKIAIQIRKSELPKEDDKALQTDVLPKAAVDPKNWTGY